MDTSSMSMGSLSDLGDSFNSGDSPKSSHRPKNDFLSTLNSEFEKSKSDLLGRFLVDQAELNRRFRETCDTDDTKESTEDNNTDHSLKETENLLRQRLALYRQDFGVERARTSMGFYNQAEFKTAEKETDSDSESGSENEDSPDDNLNKPFVANSDLDLRAIVQNKNEMENVAVQSYTRPKTSVGKKSLINPQIVTRENDYSYQTVPSSKKHSVVLKDPKAVGLAFEEYRDGYMWSLGNTQHSGRKISKSSLGISFARCRGVPKSTALRPFRRTPCLNTKPSDANVFCGINNMENVRAPFLEARLQPEIPPVSSASGRRRRNILHGGSPVSWNQIQPRDSSVSTGQLGNPSRSHKQGKDSNVGLHSDLTKVKHGCNINSFRRAQPLTLVKLPPLDTSVARRSSGHKSVTLNSACY